MGPHEGMYRGAIASEKNDPQFTRTEDPSIPDQATTTDQLRTVAQRTQHGAWLAICPDQAQTKRKLQLSLNSFRKAWFPAFLRKNRVCVVKSHADMQLYARQSGN
jgi:hypothetical protein